MKKGIMGKMTARDITKNLLQYLSMIIITCLAVTLFCGFISNALTLKYLLEDYYKKTNLTDLIVQYSSIKDEDKEFLESLDPDRLEFRIYTEGSVDGQSGKIYIAAPDNKISVPIIIEGRRGVLVDENTAKSDGILIGEKLEVEIQLPLEGGLTRLSLRLSVTGTMNFPETADTHSGSPVYIDSGTFIDNVLSTLSTKQLKDFAREYLKDLTILGVSVSGVLDYISDDALRSLVRGMSHTQKSAIFDAFCTQALIKTNNSTLKQSINDYYDGREETGFIFALGRDAMESVVMLDTEISQSLKMIYVFPVIFMLVSVLVILSTIGPLILKERGNIGTLKSVGVPDRRILMHYAFFGVVLCLIGGLLGAVLGPLIVPRVLLVKYSLVYSIPSFTKIIFSPLWSAAAVLVVCALSALIGLVICRKVAREKPAECMRPLPPKTSFLVTGRAGRRDNYIENNNTYIEFNEDYYTKKNSENNAINCDNSNYNKNNSTGYCITNGNNWGNITKRGGRQAAKKGGNVSLKMAVRNILIKPSRAFMTIVGVMGCVALLVCAFGIGDTVENSVDFELGQQFYYDIATSYSTDSESALFSSLNSLKNRGEVTHYETYKTFYMSAKGERVKDIKVFALPENPRLTTINPAGETLITKSVADDLGIKTGDTVMLSASGNSYTLLIDEIIETSFTKGIFVTDMGVLDDNYHTLDMWIATAEDADNENIKYTVNKLNGTKNAYTMEGRREMVNSVISSIKTIRLTMMVFSIALAVVVLYNLSLLNIKERHRDLATLKVLGFSTGQISRSLLFEIMILVAIGTGFGLLLGYPITALVMSINRVEVLTFIYYIKPISYVFAALLTLATAVVINLLFTRPIRKINMTESLKSVE